MFEQSQTQIKKVLIANRGEIAVRVIRTCTEMGIAPSPSTPTSIARACTSASPTRPPDVGAPPRRARATSASTHHRRREARRRRRDPPRLRLPLRERATSPTRASAAGITFIGPPASAMRKMGTKTAARAKMAQAGVPIVPGGRRGDARPTRRCSAGRKKIGYPVMLKAAAGGGGKGMRLVAAPRPTLPGALGTRAQRGDKPRSATTRVYLEKAIVRPRHVEIQVLGDKHGNMVHLFERDCSIQRRHQKVVEETPCARRDRRSSSRDGRGRGRGGHSAVGYLGAGTFEFLLAEDGSFYFLEMNTRLQVEHPVTELITGIDLVKTMIHIAAGEPMPFTQDELAITGHAIEARIYAEDPDRNFAPSPGEISVYRPPDGLGIRVDGGVYQGATVTVNYDPMVAKLIAWGRDRPEAIDRLRRALDEFVVKGIKTGIPFHLRVLKHPKFIEGKYDTGFIEQHMDGGKAAPEPDSEERRVAMMLAAIAAYRRDKERAERTVYHAGGAGGAGGGSAWQAFGRRSGMRGGLR